MQKMLLLFSHFKIDKQKNVFEFLDVCNEKKTNEKEVKIKEQLQEKSRQKQKEKNQYKKQRQEKDW